jgi:bifunctional DNase/RNase
VGVCGGVSVVNLRLVHLAQEPGRLTWTVALAEEDGPRILALRVGPGEGSTIDAAVRQRTVPRPATHDLLLHLIARLGGRLDRIIIVDVRDGIFIGQLEIGTGRGVLEIDCRPSDGIALALRHGCPMLATEDVMDRAAFVPASEDDPTWTLRSWE